MKSLTTLIALCTFFLPVSVQGQSGFTTDTIVICAPAGGKQVFTSVTLIHYQQQTFLAFKVKKVENIRNYRIEAGNDSTQLTLLGNVVPTCSSVRPVSFSFALNDNSDRYRFYRVLQVSMGHEWTASPLLIQSFGEINDNRNIQVSVCNQAASVCLKP
jgi:hypothetical protein